MLRFLFGPTTATHAEQHLQGPITSGACVPFGPEEGAGILAVSPADNWDSFCERLPAGWRPDLVVLNLAYQSVPAWLWSAPVPLVALAADAPLLWHWYRRALPHTELVLADAPTVARLHRQGIAHARPAHLFGLPRSFLEDHPEEERTIDILFIGNIHSAVQRERLSWLGRLARLGRRWKVHLDTNVFGADYAAQLRRARIVFNRSTRGECNLRVVEAMACGALLFQESANAEVPALFRDRQECVFYTEDNLEELLEHYLSHEDERRTIAAAARARVPDFTFETLWGQALAEIEGDLPALRERVRQRPKPAGLPWLEARVWQGLAAPQGSDLLLAAELHAAAARHPQDAAVHNALGLALTLHGHGGGPVTDSLAHLAAGHFQRALACDPGHAVAGLNLAEALLALRQTQAVKDVLRTVLAVLGSGSRLPAAVLESAHFPPGFDTFRVEWERAGWDNAGDPAAEAAAKHALLRWRAHTLVAELEGQLPSYYEAALARPDLPATRAALGCALGRDKLPAAAVDHLRFAATANPFDREAARALFQALRDAGDEKGARRFAHEQASLHAAAPRLVPAEKWFLEAPPVGDELASLVILCCNEVAVTRLCLESVLRHTRSPYELILVDNGSTDGTPDYLKEVAGRSGPARVEVIRNEENRGFARGCNQGLAAAQGRYLVLLNNDTVVTPGWLDRLIGWATHDWPRVGLVGAVSNYAPAPQQVEPGYRDLAGLDEFALRRARDFRGQALDFPRLTGFCLLTRREVLEQVGALDEGYGLGFFEDDDLCVRVRDKGYRLLVAQDTFIHHFGSRTFQALGLDSRHMLQANFERFKAKWGPKVAADYRLPGAGGAGILPAAPSGRQDACPTPTVPPNTNQ
jgi:GT2 family glycosyltransferase